MRAPFVDITSEIGALRGELDAAIGRVLDSGEFILGREVAAFEAELAATLGCSHAIGVSSGSDALLVTLLALGIAPGAEVVTTPLSFFATAGSVARLGARLVFADVDDASLNLDPRAALAACGERTRAILPVNLFGRPAELPAAPCPIIEDAAQSIGACGPRGLAATLSFFPTKNVGAFGDAGAVVTNDAELATRIALLRSHGARPKYHHVAVGGNFRIDALQAAVLRVKLPRLQATIDARRACATRYTELFAAARIPSEVRVPALCSTHVFNQYVIRTPRRDSLRRSLAEAGIGSEVYYPEPLHLQPCFADLGYRAGTFPNAERACQDVLALPIYPSLTAAAQGYVVDQIATFFQ